MLSSVSSRCISPAVMCQRHQCVKGCVCFQNLCRCVWGCLRLFRWGDVDIPSKQTSVSLMFCCLTLLMMLSCQTHATTKHQLSMQESNICISVLLMVTHDSISTCWDACIHWEGPCCQPRLRHSIAFTYIWYILHYTEDTICSCTSCFIQEKLAESIIRRGRVRIVWR